VAVLTAHCIRDRDGLSRFEAEMLPPIFSEGTVQNAPQGGRSTFDMSGMRRHAKRAVARPLDGGLRPPSAHRLRNSLVLRKAITYLVVVTLLCNENV